MSQITLRKLPDELDRRLRQHAKKKGKSLNVTAIRLLKKSLGLIDGSGKNRELSNIAGTWSKRAAAQFNETAKVFNKIDKELWE